MSRSVDWAFDAIQGSLLSSTARFVLLVVADYADHETGTNAYMSANTVAGYIGAHRSRVYAAFAELEREGLLIRDGKAQRNVTRWRLGMQFDDARCRESRQVTG